MEASLELLGTGGSHGVPVVGCSCKTCTSDDPKDNRMRTSAFLRVTRGNKKTCILIDCGPEFRHQALRSGIDMIHGVLITHVHADHIFGIDDLRVFCRQTKQLPMYSSQHWVDDIRERFPYIFGHCLQVGGGIPHIGLIPVETSFSVHDIPITPVPVIHGAVECYGYRFGNTAYVTDFNVIPDSAYELLKGVEQIVIEGASMDANSSHMSFIGAIDAVERIGAKRAWFTHISHRTKHEEIQRIIDEEVRRRPSLVEREVRIEPGYDGLVISGIKF